MPRTTLHSLPGVRLRLPFWFFLSCLVLSSNFALARCSFFVACKQCLLNLRLILKYVFDWYSTYCGMVASEQFHWLASRYLRFKTRRCHAFQIPRFAPKTRGVRVERRDNNKDRYKNEKRTWIGWSDARTRTKRNKATAEKTFKSSNSEVRYYVTHARAPGEIKERNVSVSFKIEVGSARDHTF